MKTINATWEECAFGIDTDGKLKLEMKIDYEGDELPMQLQLIFAFQALANVATEQGMDQAELWAKAFENLESRKLND